MKKEERTRERKRERERDRDRKIERKKERKRDTNRKTEREMSSSFTLQSHHEKHKFFPCQGGLENLFFFCKKGG